MQAGTWRLAGAAAVMAPLLLLLLAAPSVAGQGLSITPGQLGAGEAAVVDQFERFQELLDLFPQSTGGRGRGGRGGTTSKTGGTSFRSVKSLQQLQMAMYYLAGAPPAYNSWNTSQNPGGISLLPGVRDQRECNTCVGQAIAAAIQAATAAAWRQNADQAQFNVSAASLYYCSEGGKTCLTGWDLQEALTSIMDKAPNLIRLTGSYDIDGINQDDDVLSLFDWKPHCQQAEQASRDMDLRKCTYFYKPLPTFLSIQRHIRKHGSAVTRITIYDDFWKHFNVTTDGGEPRATVSGATHKAYNRTSDDSRSRPLFGHAAVIVGYNNTDLTWTLLNSYGTQRFTRDGLFKIAMGVAGVAVPDQTFGIECKPMPGGPDDPHFTDWLTPWINDKQLRPRKPVDYWDRAKDWNNLNASCYRYNMTAQDTLSSVADAFGVSLQQLVRDNQALFPLQLVKYTLKTGMQLKDLQRAVDVANKLRLDNGIEPFFVCRIYTGQTWMSSCTCKQSDLAPCAGAWACKIVYSEADVSVVLSPGTALKVCGISRVDEPGAFDRVAYLKEPRDSQPRALKILLQALPDAQQDLIVDNPSGPCLFGWCDTCYIASSNPIKTSCSGGDVVTRLSFNVDDKQKVLFPFTFQDSRAVYAFLSLQGLIDLTVGITSGTLPPQLGALQLQALTIDNRCSLSPGNWGPLPENWLLGEWHKSLGLLRIGAADANDFAAANSRCGVTGTLPASWFAQGTPAALTRLDLSYNQLTSSLPQALPKAMPGLQYLNLSSCQFDGPIPASFSTLSNLDTLDLRSNRLSGPVPLVLKPLRSIWLDDNPGLTGCVPHVSSRDENRDDDAVSYTNTGITGMCAVETLWSNQLRALNVTLPRLLGWSMKLGTMQLVAALQLPATVAAFFTANPEAAATPRRRYSYYNSLLEWRLEAVLRVMNGVPCIVQFEVSDERSLGRSSPVDMQALPDLLRHLPCLETLSMIGSGEYVKPNRPSVRHQLPADLPRVAPSLKWLTLTACGLTGMIPDWKNWTSLQSLDLFENFLTGTLPEWRDMKNLQEVLLEQNELQGTLPATWAESLQSAIGIWLSNNPGITGSIPASWWQHFSGASIKLDGTSLTGCRPPGWQNDDFVWSDALADAPFCAASEAAFLQQAKQLLQTAIPSLPLLSSWQTEGTGGSKLLIHCRTWQGITCANGQVTSVDLSSLQGATTSPLNLTALLQPLAGLGQLQSLKLQNNPRLFAGSSIPSAFNWSAWPELQHLDVSNCGLAGSLPASLGDLPSLAHLNTSHNPGMSGPLPERLATTNLAVLDVFECGLSGQLPVNFIALPLLLLRVGSVVRPASADGSISGPLPPAYGMIDTLRELHIVNTWVTGGIPSAWFDADEAAAAAAAVTASAEQPAQQENGAAARMAAAWQRVQGRLSSASSPEDAATAAAAPAGNGLSLQQLKVLVLSGNAGLEGSLPPQLAALKQLQVLRLSGGKLTGSLPDSYARLSKLQELDLSSNQLSGVIPVSWLGLRSLSLMDLSGNPAIGGSLPATLFDLAGPKRSLRCVRLFGTGASGQWEQTPGGLAAVKATFEGRPGSQVKVAISSDAPEC